LKQKKEQCRGAAHFVDTFLLERQSLANSELRTRGKDIPAKPTRGMFMPERPLPRNLRPAETEDFRPPPCHLKQELAGFKARVGRAYRKQVVYFQ
jgi:hypothetical protein